MKRRLLLAICLLPPAALFAGQVAQITLIGPIAPKVTISGSANMPTISVIGAKPLELKVYNPTATTANVVIPGIPGPPGKDGTSGASSWNAIDGKPSTFTPSAHTQSAATITGLAPVAISGSASDLADLPPTGVDPLHFAAYSTNRQSEIASKATTGTSVTFATVDAGSVNTTYGITAHDDITSTNGMLVADVITSLTGTQFYVNELVKTTDFRLSDSRPPTAHNQAAATITGLSPVATSGSYPDLINKPTIPAAQVKADWNASGTVAEILNKPTLLRGYDGREVELQTSATHIQWRYIADPPGTWLDLVPLTTITGTNGNPGKTYTCAITGGIRSLLYDKDSLNPTPTMVAFGLEMREDGAVVTPAAIEWTTPASGSLLSGSSTAATFTPTVNSTFSPGSADNRVDVVATYNDITCRATAPVPATRVGDTGLQGSPDGKAEIYTKIGAGVTGDVLNTTSGAGDASGFAFRTVRINGNIHRADLVPGKTVIYSQTTDTADTIKLQINKAGSTNPAVTISAGGALVIY